MPNCVCTKVIVDDTFIVIALHNAEPPSEAEWAQVMQLYRESGVHDPTLARSKGIAITDGGAPNTKQRNETNKWMAGRKGVACVFSESMFVRGVVTALSWVNPEIKAFSPSDFNRAMTHIGVRNSAPVMEAIQELNRQVPTKIVAAMRP